MTRPPWLQYPFKSKSRRGGLLRKALSTYVGSREEGMSYPVRIAQRSYPADGLSVFLFFFFFFFKFLSFLLDWNQPQLKGVYLVAGYRVAVPANRICVKRLFPLTPEPCWKSDRVAGSLGFSFCRRLLEFRQTEAGSPLFSWPTGIPSLLDRLPVPWNLHKQVCGSWRDSALHRIEL